MSDVRLATQSVFARWAKRLLAVIVAVFVGATLHKLGKDFDPRDIRFRLWPIALVTLVLVFANFAQAMAWAKLLDRLARRHLPRRPLCAIYCAGQLARYIPGKVALLVVRVTGAKRLGLDPRLVASSVGIEVLSWMTVGMLLGSTALGFSGDRLRGISNLLSRYSLPVAGCVVLGMLVLLLVDRNRFPGFVLRAIRAFGNGPILSWSVLAWQAASWLGCAAQAYWLPLSVGASSGQSLALVGLFMLAPIAGFLAMVAPGGLGVREAILSFALSPLLGPTRALAVALLARGVYIVSEIIAWVIARLLERKAQDVS
jgi:uncharacterized membrane protein YbhN (UPF0104 family)